MGECRNDIRIYIKIKSMDFGITNLNLNNKHWKFLCLFEPQLISL